MIIRMGEQKRTREPATHGACRREDQRDATTEYIEELIAAAPPLSPEQRDVIAMLLRPPVPGGGVSG